MRLDKFLANENIGSRKAVGVLVRSGAVTVNGQAVKKADMQVDPACDTVCVNGAPLRYNAHIYIMMNKPAGVLTATRDSRAETVLDLLPPALKRRGLFPAGRLDKDTTGLLILTDDGEAANALMHPAHEVEKAYIVTVRGPASAAQLAAMSALREIEGKPIRRPRISPLRPDGENARLRFVIHEGRNREVRRICAHAGLEVLRLVRVAEGELRLGDLRPGRWRSLTEAELKYIRGLMG